MAEGGPISAALDSLTTESAGAVRAREKEERKRLKKERKDAKEAKLIEMQDEMRNIRNSLATLTDRVQTNATKSSRTSYLQNVRLGHLTTTEAKMKNSLENFEERMCRVEEDVEHVKRARIINAPNSSNSSSHMIPDAELVGTLSVGAAPLDDEDDT